MQPPIRPSISLDNAERAYGTLARFISQDVASEMSRAAIIQAFEFTFEVFWKTFKKIAEDQGADASLPRMALSAAYRLRLIEDESLWLRMMKDRNDTSHSYREEIAERIYQAIKTDYQTALATALEKTRRFIANL